MDCKCVLLFVLLQCVIIAAVFAAEEQESASRSSHFITQKNKQLISHVAKQFESPSLLSCGQQCMRNAWCTSTNFQLSSKKDEKGICELNKGEISLINENNDFHKHEGVVFSMRLEVIWYVVTLGSGHLGLTLCTRLNPCQFRQVELAYVSLRLVVSVQLVVRLLARGRSPFSFERIYQVENRFRVRLRKTSVSTDLRRTFICLAFICFIIILRFFFALQASGCSVFSGSFNYLENLFS